MSTYTPDELKAIAEAPLFTGLAIALVDVGVVSTAIEAAALSKEIAGAADKYPNNTVIQSTFSQTALKENKIKLDQPDLKPEDIQSGAVVDQAIAAVNAALQLLEGKASVEEIAQYKQFIYDSASAVASAAGGGLFGSGNPKVSDKEAVALTKLKAALGI